MRRLRYLFSGILLVLVFTSGGSAQNYRSSVSVPPVQVYKSMMKFADQKDHEKIFLSLKVLNPILNHIKVQLSENPATAIRDAILTGDQNQVRISIQRMIYLDIKDLLKQAQTEVRRPSGNPKPLVRTAWLNYVLILPSIRKTDFKIDQSIRKSFENSFRLMGTGSIYTDEKTSLDVDGLVDRLSKIITQLDGLFER